MCRRRSLGERREGRGERGEGRGERREREGRRDGGAGGMVLVVGGRWVLFVCLVVHDRQRALRLGRGLDLRSGTTSSSGKNIASQQLRVTAECAECMAAGLDLGRGAAAGREVVLPSYRIIRERGAGRPRAVVLR